MLIIIILIITPIKGDVKGERMTNYTVFTIIHVFRNFSCLFAMILSIWGIIHNFIRTARGEEPFYGLIILWAICLALSTNHFVNFGI